MTITEKLLITLLAVLTLIIAISAYKLDTQLTYNDIASEEKKCHRASIERGLEPLVILKNGKVFCWMRERKIEG